tara:strand:- start:1133 stop:1786 length:654 start_codon:yes stop_codon:yes gene_type:complete
MKLLLLGSTGRTGRIVLEIALKKGYQVNCLARNTERIKKRKGLTIFEGNPTNENDLKKAISKCDFVISVLNISRKTDFPWSSLKTPSTFLSDAMNIVVRISKNENIKRISICSAWGVAETKNDIPKWFKWLINRSNIGIAYNEHEKQEEIISKSKLNWTIIRPVGLSNSKKEEKIIETFNNKPKPNMLISRKSLAKYLLQSLTNNSLIEKKVVVSKK